MLVEAANLMKRILQYLPFLGILGAMQQEVNRRAAAESQTHISYTPTGIPFYPGKCRRKKHSNRNHLRRRVKIRHKMRAKYNY